MHLRKTLAVAAAVAFAAGVIGLSSPAQATDPGGPIANVHANGVDANNTPIDGIFKSGTASFGGGTFNCVGGTVEGVVDNSAPQMTFDVLDIVCATPLGINATISIIDPGCVTATFADNVHDGLLDTYTDNTQGHKYDRVAGQVNIPANCVRVSVPGGCSAEVSGTVNAYFDEAIKNVGGVNYQDLHLSGTGLGLSKQTALCFGLLTGSINLNDITFNVKVTGGTTTGIDFRETP